MSRYVLTYTPDEDETIVLGCFDRLNEVDTYITNKFIAGEEIVLGDKIENGNEIKYPVYFDGANVPSGTLVLTQFS